MFFCKKWFALILNIHVCPWESTKGKSLHDTSLNVCVRFAQLVRFLTTNQKVPGSNPRPG